MTIRQTITKDVADLTQGDSLPHLDNGYVVEVDEDHDLRGDYNVAFGSGLVLVTMHDRDGEEFYLLAPPTMGVEVIEEPSAPTLADRVDDEVYGDQDAIDGEEGLQ